MLTQTWYNNFKSLRLRVKSPACAGLFVLVVGTFLTGCDLFSIGARSKVVLQVEQKSLTVGEFAKTLATAVKDLDPLSAKDPAVLKSFKNKIISDFIVDSLIESWFNENNLKINPDELAAEMNKAVSAYPDDKSFREDLAKQNLSYQDWRARVEISLKRKVLFESLRAHISKPSEEELLSYYQTNKARYFQNESVLVESILVQDENQAEIVMRLYPKNSFSILFKDYSLEKNSPAAINFGWVERASESDLEPLFSTKKSGLVGPIQMSDGFRVFKILQRKSSYQKTFEQVRAIVASDVMALRETARFTAWVDEQIKVKKILKNAKAIDALIVETREE